MTGSEFIDGIIQKLLSMAYDPLYDLTKLLFNSMQNSLDSEITRSREALTQAPQEWNATAFAFVQKVAENTVIPIAGSILIFLFCWQVVHMVQESNHMQNIKPDTMLLLMLKLGLCLLACSKAFEIVNGLFKVATWAIEQISENFSPNSIKPVFDDLYPENPEIYTFGLVVGILINMILTLIALILIYVLSVSIFIRVNIWYMELLLYASAAPIPYSTFINKEWGQMGLNYTRKILALAFEGFFMMLSFEIYNALVNKILVIQAPNAYMMGMITSVACGVALFMLLGKSGNISASIFNAH